MGVARWTGMRYGVGVERGGDGEGGNEEGEIARGGNGEGETGMGKWGGVEGGHEGEG